MAGSGGDDPFRSAIEIAFGTSGLDTVQSNITAVESLRGAVGSLDTAADQLTGTMQAATSAQAAAAQSFTASASAASSAGQSFTAQATASASATTAATAQASANSATASSAQAAATATHQASTASQVQAQASATAAAAGQAQAQANQQVAASATQAAAATAGAGAGAASAGAAGGFQVTGNQILIVAQMLNDLQYGFSAIVNQLPQVVTAFGGSAGLAGVISIVGIGISQLIKHWGDLRGAFTESHAIPKATDELERLADQIEKTGKELDKLRAKKSLTDEEFQKYLQLEFEEKQGKKAKSAAEAGRDFFGAQSDEAQERAKAATAATELLPNAGKDVKAALLAFFQDDANKLRVQTAPRQLDATGKEIKPATFGYKDLGEAGPFKFGLDSPEAAANRLAEMIKKGDEAAYALLEKLPGRVGAAFAGMNPTTIRKDDQEYANFSADLASRARAGDKRRAEEKKDEQAQALLDRSQAEWQNRFNTWQVHGDEQVKAKADRDAKQAREKAEHDHKAAVDAAAGKFGGAYEDQIERAALKRVARSPDGTLPPGTAEDLTRQVAPKLVGRGVSADDFVASEAARKIVDKVLLQVANGLATANNPRVAAGLAVDRAGRKVERQGEADQREATAAVFAQGVRQQFPATTPAQAGEVGGIMAKALANGASIEQAQVQGVAALRQMMQQLNKTQENSLRIVNEMFGVVAPVVARQGQIEQVQNRQAGHVQRLSRQAQRNQQARPSGGVRQWLHERPPGVTVDLTTLNRTTTRLATGHVHHRGSVPLLLPQPRVPPPRPARCR